MPRRNDDHERSLSTGPMARIRRDTPSLASTRRLLDYLLSGQLAPAQRLPSERQMAKDLGVGRSAVREALKSLNLLGLVDVRLGDGTYVGSGSSDLLPRVIDWGLLLDQHHVTDLVETRSNLEILAAGLAAQRRDERAIAELSALIETMRAARTDIERYVEADTAFHLRIAEASGNRVVSSIQSSIQSLLRVWATRVLVAAGETDTSLAKHLPVLEAIVAGDAEAAREAMASHMERAVRRLLATLPGSDGRTSERTEGPSELG